MARQLPKFEDLEGILLYSKSKELEFMAKAVKALALEEQGTRTIRDLLSSPYVSVPQVVQIPEDVSSIEGVISAFYEGIGKIFMQQSMDVGRYSILGKAFEEIGINPSPLLQAAIDLDKKRYNLLLEAGHEAAVTAPDLYQIRPHEIRQAYEATLKKVPAQMK